MKRILTLLVALCAISSLYAASDSLALVRAKRTKLKISGAEGYTVNVRIGHHRQQISVITVPTKRFSIRLVLNDELTQTSESGERIGAEFGINAGFWSKGNIPSGFLRLDGIDISETRGYALTRINGVVELDDNAFDISKCDTAGYKNLKSKNIISAGPILIDDGHLFDYSHLLEGDNVHRGVARFYGRQHPRTVIGLNAKGDIVLVVVDGRFPDFSAGMTIAELGKLCRWLGLTDALNLDGGGSSTMWTRQEGVVNHPCDNRTFDHEGERAVLNSLLFIKRR